MNLKNIKSNVKQKIIQLVSTKKIQYLKLHVQKNILHFTVLASSQYNYGIKRVNPGTKGCCVRFVPESCPFFCRRCGVNLCDPCALLHLRVKSKFGHDVVDNASRGDDDVCLCDSHPENKCSAYCKECDVPICILCVSIKHKSHEISELQDKIDELLKAITRENDRLQSFRDDLERVLDHTTKTLSSLSSVYERKKHEVKARGEDWKKKIDNYVKKLHQELDDLKENEGVLLKQKKEYEDVIGKIDEMNRKSTKLQNSKNVTEMQKFRPVITEHLERVCTVYVSNFS